MTSAGEYEIRIADDDDDARVVDAGAREKRGETTASVLRAT